MKLREDLLPPQSTGCFRKKEKRFPLPKNARRGMEASWGAKEIPQCFLINFRRIARIQTVKIMRQIGDRCQFRGPRRSGDLEAFESAGR